MPSLDYHFLSQALVKQFCMRLRSVFSSDIKANRTAVLLTLDCFNAFTFRYLQSLEKNQFLGLFPPEI